MKKILLILTLLLANVVCSQVGIGTINPKQTLHIAGKNATIRIEGLNATNNANNDGVNLSPVSVDANGDLVLEKKTPSAIVNLIGSAIINPSKTLKTNGPTVFTTFKSGNFTTTKDGLVDVVYSLVVGHISQKNGSPITDGKARIVGIYVKIDGNLVNWSSQSYTNYKGSKIAWGKLVLNGNHFVNLTAGNHTYQIGGLINGYDYDMQATFGGGPAKYNNFQIVEF